MSSKSLPGFQMDDLPLPLQVARKWDFPLQYHVIDGIHYYAILDWVAGLTTTNTRIASDLWTTMQRSSSFIESPISNRTLSYVATDGKTYQREFVDNIGLYFIAQHMRSSKVRPALTAIKRFLANAGAFTELIQRNPRQAAIQLNLEADRHAYDKEYQALLDEGFTPDEAKQWLEQRRHGIGTRKWIVSIWQRGGVAGRGFGILTNKVSEVAIGRSVTERKRELKLPSHETPRDYESTADLVLMDMTELTSGRLHLARESQGLDEFLEDIGDVRPIIDAARPEVYKVFSKKPRRLRGGDSLQLQG